MDYINSNDNELIYLIRLGNEDALNYMINKYEKYIYTNIKKYKINNFDDAYQDGLVALINAIKSFNDSYNKTFNKYFELILSNKLLDTLKRENKERKYYLVDTVEIDNNYLLNEETVKLDEKISEKYKAELMKSLGKNELIVFEEYFLHNYSIDDISKTNNMDKKNIYYTIYRISKKIKKIVIK